MLSTAIVLEIHRLIREGKLSQRQIALKLGVSRGTVNAIVHGRRGIFGRDPIEDSRKPDLHEPIPTRCAGCGGKVFKPCRLCQARASQRRVLLLRRLTVSRPRPTPPRRVA